MRVQPVELLRRDMQSTPMWARARLVLLAVFAVSWSLATYRVVRNPEWNLDGIYYAAIMDSEGGSVANVHNRIYIQVESMAPANAVHALTAGSDNRRALRSSPARLAAQIPFYVTKPLYGWIGKCFTSAGVSSVRAPYIVSALGFALIGLMLPLLAIAAGGSQPAAVGMAALAIWLPSLREVGALASPDALATGFFLLGAVLTIVQLRAAVVPLAAAVLTRPDMIILACGVLGARVLREKNSDVLRDASMIASLLFLVAGLIVPLTGGYGWSAVVRSTFIEAVIDDVSARRALSVEEYFVALSRGVRGAMTNHTAGFVPYLMLTAVSLSYAVRSQTRTRGPATLLIGIWVATGLHFLAIPILHDRFFAAAYMGTLAIAAALIAPALPAERFLSKSALP